MATTPARRGRRTKAAEAPAETTAETATVQEDTMTDVQDRTEDQTAQEPEAGTVEAGHTFNIGDKARVIRGKLRGQNGKIIAFNEADKTYAITLDSGTLAVVNAGNLKAPADSTVSVQALVAALATLQADDPTTTARVAALIDSVSPGFSAKLAEHTAE
jgi:ribosomal protein L24